MEKMLGPTGRLLVGAVFICFLILPSLVAAELPPDLPDLQKGLKEAQSGYFDHNHREWAARQPHTSNPLIVYSPLEEKIALNESHSMEQVSDLVVMNGAKEREIIYDGEQNGDPDAQGLTNFLDIGVTGQDEAKKIWPDKSWDDSYIDKIVNNAFNTSMKNEMNKSQISRRGTQSQSLGNNLNIDVSGISVSAINTVPGGSAVATSNIIIKPVQIIICPPDVEEKLK